jgi:all-trans-retinol dehydrogenase (NAD+)
MAFSLFLNILAVLWHTLSGSVRALFSCRTRYKSPDVSSDVCLVTGAGQGLGRQLALQFAKCGATLVLWDIDGRKIGAVAEEIKKEGGAAHPYVVDCSKREEVYRMAGRVKEEVGNVAVLVNNAGIAPEKAFVNGDLKDEEIEKTYAVNALALYWTVRAFLPWMLDSNYGYIVNISSVAAFGGYPYAADYSASKAAVLNFSETLRSELLATGRSGINVTCVCPLFINTRMVWESRALKKGHSEPTMEPHYVARRILTAMADRQFLLALPTILHLARFLKSMLPQKAYDTYLFKRFFESANPLNLTLVPASDSND